MSQSAVPTFLAYSPSSGKSEKSPPLKQPRFNFGTTVLGNDLYAIGGYGLNERLIHSAEKYDFDTGVWCDWINLPYPRACMTCYISGGVLYCIGGEEYNNGAITLKVDSLMLKLTEESWHSIASMVSPIIFPSVFKIL